VIGGARGVALTKGCLTRLGGQRYRPGGIRHRQPPHCVVSRQRVSSDGAVVGEEIGEPSVRLRPWDRSNVLVNGFLG
jgi:hypothetical protein